MALIKKVLELVKKLHKKNVAHGDIKIGNILSNPDFTSLLFIDFGHSCILDSTNCTIGHNVDYYAWPQYVDLNTSIPSVSSKDKILFDYYSVGVLIYEILFNDDTFYTIDKDARQKKLYNSLSQINDEPSFGFPKGFKFTDLISLSSTERQHAINLLSYKSKYLKYKQKYMELKQLKTSYLY